MKEAGYEWDAVKKKLKKIDNKNPMPSNFFKAVYEREKADSQKSDVWREEDELHIRELESLVKQVWAIAEHENDKGTIRKMRDLSFFLKTLKPEIKQEMSEKDIEMIGNIRSIIEKYAFSQSAVDVNGDLCEKEYIDADYWLKSLKERVQLQPQKQWKPSDEQMNTLEYYMYTLVCNEHKEILFGLYSDLMKLK